MSYDEAERLRKSGNLDEAYQMASLALMEARQVFTPIEPNTISDPVPPDDEHNNQVRPPETQLDKCKRAMAWVLYEYLKRNTEKDNYQDFINHLNEFSNLDLDENEKMVTNQVLWLVGKVVFEYTKDPDFEVEEMERLFDIVSQFNFSRQNKGYSILFKAFHKALKESDKYLEFADWWDFHNFIHDDYNVVLSDDGTKIMSIVEQAYNKYSKHLIKALEAATNTNREEALTENVRRFIPKVEEIIRRNKFYRKLQQYLIRLHLAGGEYSKAFAKLIKRVKERQDDFWVWEMIADAYDAEPEKKIACLCAALRCKTNITSLIQLREKLIEVFVMMEMYNEAKTEIASLLHLCHHQKLAIPDSVAEWGNNPWYRASQVMRDNEDTYRKFSHIAEDIIYHDIPQKKVVVEFVNMPKKILNFVTTDFSKGYFKFGSSLGRIKEGDVILVRIKKLDEAGRFELIQGKKINEKYVEGLLKDFAGEVVILPNKPFGFVSGNFLPPDLCEKYRIEHGDRITGMAMNVYNKKKEEWGWKVIAIN